jgi:hypothetical protein
MKELNFKELGKNKLDLVFIDEDKTKFKVKINDDFINAIAPIVVQKSNAQEANSTQEGLEESQTSDQNSKLANASAVKTSTKTSSTLSSSSQSSSVGDRGNEQSVSPREIQQFIRSGLSAEDLHNRFGIPLEKIRKYSVPIEHEKSVILNLFHNLPAREERKGRTLLNIVNEYFDEFEIDREEAYWVVTQTGKKPWLIRLHFKNVESDLVATWYWDQKNAIISENDEIAKEITQYYLDASFVSEGDKQGTPIGRARQSQKPVTDWARTDWGKASNANVKNLTGSLRLIDLDLDQIKADLDSSFKGLSETKHDADELAKSIDLPVKESTPSVRTKSQPTVKKDAQNEMSNDSSNPDDIATTENQQVEVLQPKVQPKAVVLEEVHLPQSEINRQIAQKEIQEAQDSSAQSDNSIIEFNVNDGEDSILDDISSGSDDVESFELTQEITSDTTRFTVYDNKDGEQVVTEKFSEVTSQFESTGPSDSHNNGISRTRKRGRHTLDDSENTPKSDEEILKSLNVTGELRTGFSRSKSKRSSVARWDEIMLPKNGFKDRFKDTDGIDATTNADEEASETN